MVESGADKEQALPGHCFWAVCIVAEVHTAKLFWQQG